MRIQSLAYLLIPFLLSSCVHTYYYIPNTINAPLLKEKKDLRISGSMGTSMGGDNSAEFQGAYALTKNIGLMTNYMYANDQGDSDYASSRSKINFLEGAIGYFKPLNKTTVFEIYGGYGGGNQRHDFTRDQAGSLNNIARGTVDLSYHKIFVQPSWGYATKGFEFALSSRFSRLFYTDFRYNNYYYAYQYGLDSFINTNHLLIEPALTIRAGVESVKFQLQYLRSFATKSSDYDFIRKNHLSVGLIVSLPYRSKTK